MRNVNIQNAYNKECELLKSDYLCYNKFGTYTEIKNVVKYSNIDIIFYTSKNITTLHNYHNNNPAYFYLFENDLGPSACLKRGFRWEEHQHYIIDKYLNKDSVAIEIGSHIGSITIKLSK